MSKGSIVVVVIGVIILIGGQVINGLAQQKKASHRRSYSYSPPYSSNEEREVAEMLALSRQSMPVGATIGAVGALWLIVSVIQGSNKKKEQD